MLKLRLGKPPVPRVPETEDARSLCQSALDAGSEGVARLEVRCLLPLAGRY